MKCIRFVGLVVIPLVIGFCLFFPRSVDLPITKENNETLIVIPDFSELNERAGTGRMLRTLFSTPFDLKYYTITIEDVSSYTGPKSVISYDLYLNGQPFNSLQANGKTEKTILANDKKAILVTNVRVTQGDNPPGLVEATIDFKVSAKPSWYDVMAKIFLVLIAWNGIFFLGKDVYEFVG